MPRSEPAGECVASGRVTGDFDDRAGKVCGLPRQIVTDTAVDDRVCIFAREFLGIRDSRPDVEHRDQDYRFARTVVFVVQLKIPRIPLLRRCSKTLCNSSLSWHESLGTRGCRRLAVMVWHLIDASIVHWYSLAGSFGRGLDRQAAICSQVLGPESTGRLAAMFVSQGETQPPSFASSCPRLHRDPKM